MKLTWKRAPRPATKTVAFHMWAPNIPDHAPAPDWSAATLPPVAFLPPVGFQLGLVAPDAPEDPVFVPGQDRNLLILGGYGTGKSVLADTIIDQAIAAGWIIRGSSDRVGRHSARDLPAPLREYWDVSAPPAGAPVTDPLAVGAMLFAVSRTISQRSRLVADIGAVRADLDPMLVVVDAFEMFAAATATAASPILEDVTAALRTLLEEGPEVRVHFVVVEGVGDRRKPLWAEALGHRPDESAKLQEAGWTTRSSPFGAWVEFGFEHSIPDPDFPAPGSARMPVGRADLKRAGERPIVFQGYAPPVTAAIR